MQLFFGVRTCVSLEEAEQEEEEEEEEGLSLFVVVTNEDLPNAHQAQHRPKPRVR